MRHLFAVAALVVGGALAAPGALAFRSIEEGDSPHDEITGVADELGWPEDAVRALQAAVRQPDIDDLQPAPVEGNKDRMDASVTYRPWHHCARQPPGGDAEAFNATVAYVHEQRALAENLSLLDPAAAVRALGRALHAVQDCFSHSNVVDLDAAAQAALTRALVHSGAPPAGLLLCGVAPGTPDIERPAGDPFPHAEFNKDDTGSSPEAEAAIPGGGTKYDAAHAAAEVATREFLRDFMGRLDADERERVLTVRISEAQERRGLPAAPVLAAVALSLAAAAALRRR